MSIVKLATIKQETRKGDEDVLPILKKDLELIGFSPYTSLKDVIMDCFDERAKLGIEHYKTPLQTNNGHDPLVDAFQEALDLVMYLAQDTIENKHTDYSLQNQAIRMLMAIALRLNTKYGTDIP